MKNVAWTETLSSGTILGSSTDPCSCSSRHFICVVLWGLTMEQVPASWSKCYPSLKPLGAWMRDLIQRAEHIRGWAMVAMPKVFWLPCMTYPSGETALL